MMIVSSIGRRFSCRRCRIGSTRSSCDDASRRYATSKPPETLWMRATTALPSLPNQYYTTTKIPKRYLSKGWTGARGHDLTSDLLDYDKEMGIPKITVSGYGESGFMVKNMIKKLNTHNTNEDGGFDSDGSIYMNGSIIAYPTGCFLWNIGSNGNQKSSLAKSVTIESLSSLLLIRPHIEYLFIGCNDGYGSIPNLNEIQSYMRLHSSSSNNYSPVVVEQMLLYNAIGTFNLLNAEDRQVAVALIVDSSTSDN